MDNEKKVFAVFFNLFYGEIWQRLSHMEDLWASVKSVEEVWEITGDICMWPCHLLKVSYTVKDGFNEDKVWFELEKLAKLKDFNNFW